VRTLVEQVGKLQLSKLRSALHHFEHELGYSIDVADQSIEDKLLLKIGRLFSRNLDEKKVREKGMLLDSFERHRNLYRNNREHRANCTLCLKGWYWQRAKQKTLEKIE
jgi:hypothetical protein